MGILCSKYGHFIQIFELLSMWKLSNSLSLFTYFCMLFSLIFLFKTLAFLLYPSLLIWNVDVDVEVFVSVGEYVTVCNGAVLLLGLSKINDTEFFSFSPSSSGKKSV